MKECTAELTTVLGLAHEQVTAVVETATGWRVPVESPQPAACPVCDGTRWHRHARLDPRVVAHTWVADAPVPVAWTPVRSRCVACHHTAPARPVGLAPWQRWSPAAPRAALQRLTRDSVRGVATVLGVGEGRLRRLVDTPGPLDDDTWGAHPGDLVLSIDEASFRGTDLCITIALLAPERRVLTILADDRIATLDAWFARIPPDGRARIRGGCIDMKVAYRKAIQRACPRAQVLVDPFHIVKEGTHRLDEARRDEQDVAGTSIRRWPLIKGVEHRRPHPAAALATLPATYPALGALHRLKEDLRQLLQAPDRATAAAQLSRWLINAEACDHAEGYAWAQTIKRWRPAILARWELGREFPHGFIEGCHTKIKAPDRLSYGFRNRDRYRRKMLLGFLPETAIPQLLT